MAKFSLGRVVTLVLLLFLIGVAGFLFWANFISAKNTVTYQTASVTKGNIVKSVAAAGSLLAGGSFEVAPSTTGVVSGIFVSPGQDVTAGQKMATLSLDQKGIKNRDKLWGKYLGAKSNFESVRAQASPYYLINQAQYELNLAWNDYNDSLGVITSPLAGKVLDIKAVVGSPVNGGSIATIQTSREVLALVSVSEMDIPSIHLGQKVQIAIPALSGKQLTGKVVSIDTSGAVKSSVVHFTVTVALDNPSAGLLTNMSADAKIILAEKDNTLIVPLSAVHNSNGNDSVTVLKNGKASEVAVKIGLTNDTQAEIISGIGVNDTVVTASNSSQPSNSSSTSIFNGLTSPGGLAVPGGGSNN